MEEWKEYKIGDICRIKHGFAFKGIHFVDEPQKYVCVTPGNFALKGGFKNDKPKYYNGPIPEDYVLQKDDLVVTMTDLSKNGDTLGYSALIPYDEHYIFLHNQRIGLIEDISTDIDKHFLYWVMRTYDYQRYIVGHCSGSTVKHTSPSGIGSYIFRCPEMKMQKEIASVLDNLDDKIEVNRRINDNFYLACLEVILIWLLTSLENDNLEQQAQALFKSWFVDFEPFKDSEFEETEFGLIPRGWKVVSLSVIADYINGLAMQKYRPIEGEKGLPVLKIKELGQGSTDDYSELCSPSLIGEKYIIDDGDIIFSWSGTLMVKVWCGGKCGLNQHLFVVEPKDYPHWFAYQWTKHHLDNFIHIAKDKAVTMGHIKRGELDKAKVVVPDGTSMAAIDSMMKPLHSQIISNKIESRRLASMRDTILPRLMSG